MYVCMYNSLIQTHIIKTVSLISTEILTQAFNKLFFLLFFYKCFQQPSPLFLLIFKKYALS